MLAVGRTRIVACPGSLNGNAKIATVAQSASVSGEVYACAAERKSSGPLATITVA